MRIKIILVILLLFQQTVRSQKLEMNLDSINPVIKHDSHGDSIRKYFSSTYNGDSYFTEGNLLVMAFFSNQLAVNYTTAHEKIPQLRQFAFPKMNETYGRPVNSYAGVYAVPIFDSTGVIVTVNGITPQNANRYQFRVLEDNKKVILPWSNPKLFTKAYMMTKIAEKDKIDEVTAYLGQFKGNFDKTLTFQVRQIDKPDSIAATFSAYWVKWPPKVLGVFKFSQLPDFLNVFKNQWTAPMEMDNSDWSKDSTLLKLQTEFQYDDNNLIFYLDGIIKSKKIIEYNLVKDGNSTGWKTNDYDYNFIWLTNLSPGNYQLKIRYSVQRMNESTYNFTIHPAWYQTLWAKTALGIVAILAIGFIMLLWRSKRQATHLKAQRKEKQLIQTELKSIRSQFNPHFVFNALSSIQGLITKKDSANASKYLIEFSSLMRDSLKASDNEFVSIATEVKILENYLNLEKLRFGFDYEIITEGIDKNAIEIPSLFLQPLVENAVKHGISALQEQGRLDIAFKQEGNHLVIIVQDNGNGFDLNHNTKGFGLQLTKERVKLLNQTLNDQEIMLSADRQNGKTLVIVHFKNWLL